MASPLQRDPSRTLTLRMKAVADMKRRFRKAKKQVKDLVVKEDAFGLKEGAPDSTFQTFNQRFAFQTDVNKVASFQSWLKIQVLNGILFADDTNEPWMSEYIESAYKRGVTRGFEQVRPIAAEANIAFYEGTKAEFLSSTFAAPELTNKLELLYTRTFVQLEGITNDIDSKLSAILAQGLADGKSAQAIASEMTKQIDKIQNVRALRLARTEIVRAQAEGQLDSYERLGIEEVGILAEYSTAGDDKVCEQCQPLEGIILTVSEARGIIPRHPNCRCAFVPSFKDAKQPGQIWEPARVRSALKKSTLARKKKETTLKEAKEKETWTGADTKITGEGRE